MGISNQKSSFPVVGIGASAGGLEALEGFFTQIPNDCDISFVVIQHLDPSHESMMESLLRKHTGLAIQVIEDEMLLKPNAIYLNPPKKNVALVNGAFKLSPVNPENKGFFRIDHFFRSLAEDQGDNAVCIVLSGTGSDGTIGLREIKSSGGLTMVQKEEEAGYGGMPNSAINTGLVDVVVSTDNMAEELIQYLRHPYMAEESVVEDNLKKQQDSLNKLFNLLRKETGHDFSNYKLNTIHRRIERRMAVHQIQHLGDYLSYVQSHKAELQILFKELLITVTSFFRDPEAFELLKKQYLPELLNQVPEDNALRVWVPGCATGEEAYSIAMLLWETMEEQDKMVDCKLFASDIDISSIEFARQGLYPESIKADVSKDRLNRFFIKEDDQYRIKKQIRDMVIFANQNLIKDPPFSNLDLISCRNVLIYMNQDMHKKLFPVFYYALNHDGLLILGGSETVGEFEKVFEPLDNHIHLFRKKNGYLEDTVNFPPIPQSPGKRTYETPKPNLPNKQNDIKELVEKTILQYYCYPSVLVNENFDIFFIYGHTEDFLTLPKGKASLNLLNVTKQKLQYKLINTLRKAIQTGSMTKAESLQIQSGDNLVVYDLLIHPLKKPDLDQQLMLIVFQEKTPHLKEESVESKAPEEADEDNRMVVMERELKSTIEQLEISNQELQSKNEEIQATNEELQSSIEELETSKEEAQSTNEELTSVNSELKQKIADLNEANNDINNLLASTEIATIFLDSELHIKRFTPDMSNIFNLIQSDLGRPISDITSNINYENVYEDAQHVLRTLEKQEKEIETDSGYWYAVRVMPYRTTENVINGVVITFVDITETKLSQEANRLAAVIRDANDAITVVDLSGKITAWNRSAELMYGYKEPEALTLTVKDLLPADRQDKWTDMITKIQSGETVPSFETERITKNGERKRIWLTVSALLDHSGNTYALTTTERSLGERSK